MENSKGSKLQQKERSYAIQNNIAAYIRQLIGEHEKMKELTSETMLKMHQSIRFLKDNELLRVWVQRKVQATLSYYHRKNKKQFPAPPVNDESAEEKSNESLIALIRIIFESLTEQERSILEAVELRDESEIFYANQNNLPLVTVKSMIQRARNHLKDNFTNLLAATE